jgi:hypothetical protein
MTTFNYEGYDFEGRQTESQNIVWLAGRPDMSGAYPRSFTFEEVAVGILLAFGLPF